MKTRIREHSKAAQNLFSSSNHRQSEPILPINNRTKAKIHLPQIKKRNRYVFFDDVHLSQDYIKISNEPYRQRQLKKNPDFLLSINKRKWKSSNQQNKGRNSQMISLLKNLPSERTPTERSFSMCIKQCQQCPLQDRIWQKRQESQKKYKQLLQNINRKISERHKKKSKQGMELVLKRSKVI